MDSIYKRWLLAKSVESEAAEARRALEDEMIQLLDVDLSNEGSNVNKPDGYKVKTTVRINRTIDGDKLQEIAQENGLSGSLSDLFRWKPSINMTEWKRADSTITSKLSAAITAKPGRPSFSIEAV